jgi:lipoprotein-anchoring transpeptidase ErfK/SrfK
MPGLVLPVIAAMLGCAVVRASADSSALKAVPCDTMLAAVSALKERFPDHPNSSVAVVSISRQMLYLYRNDRLVKTYAVSTSKLGAGNKGGSFMTPLGAHCVKKKLGGGAPLGTIFIGRQNTHQIATIINDKTVTTDYDLITTRILWLDGLEPGVNRGKGIDSYARYIYIHGTQEEGLIGQPVSHGCVRMTNHDVVELYDELQENDLVSIVQ